MTDESKKVLLILGNGFDLACGYKTKFDDFYDYIIKNDTELNSYNFFIQLIRATFFSDDESNKYFQKILDINKKENWMDIELLLNHFLYGEMYEIAKNVFDSFKPQGYVGDTTYPKGILKIWMSNCSLNLKKGFNYFLLCHLHQFELSLSNYLNYEAVNSSFNSKRVDKIFYQLVNADTKVKLLNFNYTIPFEAKENVNMCFVHGSIYDKNIIVGVDSSIVKNDPNIDKKKIFTKTFRKMDLDLSNCDTNKVLEKGIDKIVFYGHSLGKQDYSYFQSIFDFYDLYNSDVILLFCYNEYDATREKTEKEILINRIYELINLYGTTLDNKEHGKNMLHKLLLENRIILKEIFPPSPPIKKIVLR